VWTLLSRLSVRRSDDHGFTLIELLVVIIIIGILAAIAIPVFLNQRKKGWDAQAKSDARNLASLEESYIVDHDAYLDFDSSTGTSPAEEFDGYRDSDLVVTKAKASSAFGYCIISKSRSQDYFVYDSQAGGLDGDPHGSVPSFTAGTSCAAAAPSMP
jgi:type IV pilus assembly protein PilA